MPKFLISAVALSLLLTGCVVEPPPGPGSAVLSSPPKPVVKRPDLEAEIHRLSETVDQLEKSEARERQNFSTLMQRIALFNKETADLRGALEMVRHETKQMREELVSFQNQKERRNLPDMPAIRVSSDEDRETDDTIDDESADDESALANSVKATAPKLTLASKSRGPVRVAQADVLKKSQKSQKPASAKEAYDAAFRLIKSGQYEAALKAFSRFLEWFPEDGLSDNAQYWVGEMHYVQRRYPDALMAFNQVLIRWPTGDKVPASLLKIGFSFYELKDLENARRSLKKVVQEYAASPESTLAKQRLEKMEQ